MQDRLLHMVLSYSSIKIFILKFSREDMLQRLWFKSGKIGTTRAESHFRKLRHRACTLLHNELSTESASCVLLSSKTWWKWDIYFMRLVNSISEALRKQHLVPRKSVVREFIALWPTMWLLGKFHQKQCNVSVPTWITGVFHYLTIKSLVLLVWFFRIVFLNVCPIASLKLFTYVISIWIRSK